MSDPAKPPKEIPVVQAKPPQSLWELLLALTQKRFGTTGVGLLLVIALICTIAWNWREIRAHSLFESVRSTLFSERLPTCDAKAICILIANIEGDKLKEYKNNLVSRLGAGASPATVEPGKALPIKVQGVDRYIERRGAEAVQAFANGGEKARHLLNDTKADILIWGRLEKDTVSTTPTLYFSSNSERRPTSIGENSVVKLASLSEVELPKMLQVLADLQWSQIAKDEGFAYPDGTVQRIQVIFNALRISPTDLNSDRRDAAFLISRAKGRIGRTHDNAQLLFEASEEFERLKRSPNVDPLRLAEIELDLGAAKFGLAFLNDRRASYEAALGHFKLAKELASQVKNDRLYALSRNGSAGTYLQILSSLPESDRIPQLEIAIHDVDEAITRLGSGGSAVDLTKVMLTKSIAYRLRGELTQEVKWIDQAISSLEKVVGMRPREKMPIYWANSTQSLGNAWYSRAQISLEDGDFERAILAYKSALEEYSFEQFPEMNGNIHYNAANARIEQSISNRNISYRAEALSYFCRAQRAYLAASSSPGQERVAKRLTELSITESCLSHHGV
jgi:tetratricopeptide (TPR) repeat protein